MPELNRPAVAAPRGRSLAESVTLQSMPAGVASAVSRDVPTLALCLQWSAPREGFYSRLISCSLAANFGGRDTAEQDASVGDATPDLAAPIDPTPGRILGRAYPAGITVAVIRPLARPQTPTQWHPSLSHLVALALREAAVSPARLRDEPILLALYGNSPARRGLRDLFHPALPARRCPLWLRMRVPDLAGRRYAGSVWTVDLEQGLGKGGLERLTEIVRAMLGAAHPAAGSLTAQKGGAGVFLPEALKAERERRRVLARHQEVQKQRSREVQENPAAMLAADPGRYYEWAAEQARFALFFTRAIQQRQIGIPIAADQ